MNYNQEHTACIRWNKVVFNSNLHNKGKKKGIVTLESLITSCWSLIPTKLLLMPNKNTLLIMNSSTSFFLLLFTPSHINNHYLLKLFETDPLLCTSFIPTQVGKPFTLLLGQTSPLLCLSSFSIPTLLGQAPILYMFSPICPWVE